MRGTLVVCADIDSLYREAVRRITTALARAGERQKIVSLALSGGKTPRTLYQWLAREEFRAGIPWDKLHLFWSDERLVPLDHRESNYRMAREALLNHVPVPPENIHSAPVHLALEEAAQTYEQEIRTVLGNRRGIPCFDVILLGLGADGHVASLFPRAETLRERKRLVVVARSPVGMPRVTLTVPVLNQARHVFYLVTGAEKSQALQQAVEGAGELPAQLINPAKGELVWFLDCPAAARLERVRVET